MALAVVVRQGTPDAHALGQEEEEEAARRPAPRAAQAAHQEVPFFNCTLELSPQPQPPPAAP